MLELELAAIAEAEDPLTCPCGHHPTFQLCLIRNRLTGHRIEVGNACVNRFIGLDTRRIFFDLLKIRRNRAASIGADTRVFFHETGVISDWERKFSADTQLKRDPSRKQLQVRTRINSKVLAAVYRASRAPAW